MVETIQWTDGAAVMIDQTRLPLEEKFVTCRTYEEVAAAIRDMIIRGAPAIGVAAAMGVALGVVEGAPFDVVCETLAKTRPTAVNLFWAIDRMKRLYASLAGQPRSRDLPRAWWKRRNSFAKKISPSAAPSAATARRLCPTARPCSRTAMPARSPPRDTAPRWA